MSRQEDHERGQPPRERGAEDMIEQRPSPERRKASAALDEARLRQQAIGVRLRQMFDEVVNEDVPEEFLEILRRADERGSEKA
ncbi:MAG: NepR family anti-sigma factor [Phenylobacterium sp.]|nr:NepR family anti-sigma factor [Phenylobacterium sp.]